MADFNGTQFSYNPAVTNVNIDNLLAGILSKFDDDYIMGAIDDSLNSRFTLDGIKKPNIVAAYEANFKDITDGFSSYSDDIAQTRQRVYISIIRKICQFYDFEFTEAEDVDYYSAAYWIYEFLVSSFTRNVVNFYVSYLIKERESICTSLDLMQLRKENDSTYSYSKKLFKDPRLAAIHCNLEYAIEQMTTFPIDLWTILSSIYTNEIASYIYGLIKDRGNFFKNFCEIFVVGSKDSADVLTYIKLQLQEAGGEIEQEV